VSNPFDPPGRHSQPDQPGDEGQPAQPTPAPPAWQPADPWSSLPVSEVPVTDSSWAYPAADPSGWLQPVEPAQVPKRRWPWIVATVAMVLALVGGAGAFAAYRALNGGGTQPEQVLPADVFGFAKADLDPAAGQKLLALRFLHKLPTVGKSFAEHKDPKQSIFEALAASGDLPKDLAYDRDIKPWLGDRLAVAARPAERSGEQPEVIVAVQVKNEAEARTGIHRITRDAADPVGFAFRDGYALLAQNQHTADRAAADAGKSTLHDAPDFAADMKLLGGSGVSAGWVDSSRLAKESNGLIPTDALGFSPFAGTEGRSAYVLRFIDGGAEVVSKSRGVRSTTEKSSTTFPKLGDLPGSTVGAMRIRGVGQVVDQIWAGVKKMSDNTGTAAGINDFIRDAKQHVGLTLPDDVKTLLGSDLLFAVSSDGLADTPQIGGRMATDPAAADKVLRAVSSSPEGASLGLKWKQLPDGVAVSNVQSYADLLGSLGGPKLSEQKDFRDAVPDADQSSIAGYVNLRAIGDIVGPKTAEEAAKAWLSTFRSLGFTVTNADDVSTMHLRLLLR
jgi:hypothetical protein